MNDEMPLVRVDDVHKKFRRGAETIEVLRGVDLELVQGDFLALMGPSGSGKTTLLNALLQKLNGSIHTVMINNPRISTADLYRSLYLGFGFKARYKSKVNFLKALHNFLKQGLVKGQNAVLIIDEAQALPINLLEEVRLRSTLSRPAFRHRPSASGLPDDAASTFKLGQRVRHPMFGDGVVLTYEGEGRHASVQVNFEDAGSKWLVLAYAKLEAV